VLRPSSLLQMMMLLRCVALRLGNKNVPAVKACRDEELVVKGLCRVCVGGSGGEVE